MFKNDFLWNSSISSVRSKSHLRFTVNFKVDDLLKETIEFATEHITLDPIEIETIKNSRLSILHHYNKVWTKKMDYLT